MKLDEIAEELTKLQAQVEELRVKENKPWEPNVSSKCWYLSATGYIEQFYWHNTKSDLFMLAESNVFQTEELAQAALDRKLLKHKILKDLTEANGDWVADWEQEWQEKYSLQAFKHEYRLCQIISTIKQPNKYPAKSEEIWGTILDRYGHREVAEALEII